MCHVFPCVMQKTTFPSRNTPIDKRNLFLLSGRVVSHFRHESLQEKQVPTDRKNNSQILIICENKILKAELYKSNFVTKITECNYLFIFQNSPHFLVNLFVILVSFHYFTFCFKFSFPIADIIVNHLYIRFLRSRKTNAKCYNKKTKKFVVRNIAASKKTWFSDLCQTRFSRSRQCGLE